MTRRRIKFYRAALRSCGFCSEPLRVRAGSRRGEKALGRRSPEVAGMKGLGGTWQRRWGSGPEASLRPRASSVQVRASGRGWTAPACPERPSGSRPARIANKRNSVSPGAAWVLPMGSPHPRSVCVPSLGGFYAELCGRCSASTPRGRVRRLAWLRRPGGEETLGRHHVGKRRRTGSCPEDTRLLFFFSQRGRAQSEGRGPEKAPSERSSCLEVMGPSDERPDSQSTRAFSHRR